MSKIDLSIIIPIYNVSQYLDRCLNPILSIDDSTGVEVLLIDDGSTDNSGIIADEYSKKYSFVKTYHKANGGLSDARNYGTIRSKGKYVMYIDSDDEIDSQCLSKIINIIKNSDYDCISWNAITIDEDSKIIPKEDNSYLGHGGLSGDTLYSVKDFITNQVKNHNDFVTTAWIALFKREILIDNNLYFEKGLLHEDDMWTPRAFLNCRNIYYVDMNLYKYRVRNNSIMTDNLKSEKKLHDIVFIYSSLYAFFNWKVSDEQLKKTLKGAFSKRYLYYLGKSHWKLVRNVIKSVNRGEILRNARGKKDKFRAFLLLLNCVLYAKVSAYVKK